MVALVEKCFERSCSTWCCLGYQRLRGVVTWGKNATDASPRMQTMAVPKNRETGCASSWS
eukprot:6127149-Amphidinium_carterae.2